MSWGVKFKSYKASPSFERDINDLMHKLAEDFADFIFQRIMSYLESGRPDWPALSEVTKQLKGHDKILVGSGDYKRSIKTEVEGNRARVGILTPRGPSGQDMELIAKVIEGGATIPVTEKMRKWLASRGVFLRKTTMFITIPPRPVFNSAMDEYEDILNAKLSKFLTDALEKV